MIYNNYLAADDEFFILYYQFFKNAFGFQYCNDTNNPTGLRIYFDKLPDTEQKNENFKNFIFGLQFREPLLDSKIFINRADITEVDSKRHVILQCMDIILGSMNFRLNDKML